MEIKRKQQTVKTSNKLDRTRAIMFWIQAPTHLSRDEKKLNLTTYNTFSVCLCVMNYRNPNGILKMITFSLDACFFFLLWLKIEIRDLHASFL